MKKKLRWRIRDALRIWEIRDAIAWRLFLLTLRVGSPYFGDRVDRWSRG